MNAPRVTSHSVTFRSAAAIAAGLVLLHLGLTIILQNDLVFSAVLKFSIHTFVNGLATLSLFYAARCSKEQGKEVQTAWLTMAMALLFNMVGEVITIIILFGALPTGFPTVANWFYLVSNPLVAVGILMLVMSSLDPSQRFKTVLDAGIFFVAAILFCSAFVILPIIAPTLHNKYSTLSSLALSYSLAYAVMDTVLFFACLQLLFVWRRSAVQVMLFLLLTGALGLIVTDTLDAADILRTPMESSLIRVSWSICYALVGLAGFRQATMRQMIWKPLQAEERINRLAGPVQATYLWVIGACFLLLWNNYFGLLIPSDVLLWGVIAIIGLALIRQFLSQRENTQLQAAVYLELTERRRAEKSLRLLDKALETTNIGITITDLEGKIIYTNPAEAKLHGYTVNELLGKPASIFAPLSQAHPPSNKKVRQFSTWQRETLNVRKDGSIFPAQLISDAVADANGDPIGIVTCCQDISERKQAEEASRASEARLRRITDNMMDVISEIDLEGKLLYASPSHQWVLGDDPTTLIGTSVLNRLHPDDANPALTTLIETSSGGKAPGPVTFRYQHADGRYLWMECIGSIISNPDGLITGFVLASRDVTARKQAEQALQQAKENLEVQVAVRTTELRESEIRFRTIFEQSGIGIALTDMNVSIIKSNPAMQKFFGYNDEELKALGIRPLTYPDDATIDLELAHELLQGKRDHYQIEKRLVRKDKQLIWGHLTVSLMRDADAKPLYGIAMIEDITERKHAEESLRQLSRAVEQSPASIVITDTLGNIEYVNPKFTDLTGYSQAEALGQNPRILKSGKTPPQVHKELWETITTGKEWHGEFVNRKKNGELYFEIASISPIFDERSNVTHFLAVKEDVTASKRADQVLKQRANELKTLYETSLEVNAETNLDKLLQTIINRAAQLIQGDMGSLHLLDSDNVTLRLSVGYNLNADLIGTTERFGEGVAGLVAQRREPLVIDDYAHWDRKTKPYADFGAQHALGVPLVVPNKVIGAIVVAKFHPDERFTEEEARLVRLFADQAALAIDRARLYNDVQLLAITDELTGMYNRRGLFQFGEREVERALRFHRPLSAIMFDIDHFKLVNDQYSHAAGDQVLRAIAECGRINSRHLDILGRYGGEEFVLLLPETDCQAATYVAERLRQSIQDTAVSNQGYSIRVTVSMGLVETTSETQNLAALINHSDQALLRAKERGRNRVEIFGR